MHAYVHIHIHTYIDIRVVITPLPRYPCIPALCADLGICTCTYMCIYMYTHLIMYPYVCMVVLCIHIYVNLYIHVYLYLCMCTFLYLYIHLNGHICWCSPLSPLCLRPFLPPSHPSVQPVPTHSLLTPSPPQPTHSTLLLHTWRTELTNGIHTYVRIVVGPQHLSISIYVYIHICI